MTRAAPSSSFWTLSDVLERFGDVPPQRIRLDPAPGKAREKDVLRIMAHEGRLYELVDGVLVEKTMGMRESALACEIIQLLGSFAKAADLGFVAGTDCTLRLLPGQIRLPDVAFFSWERLPDRFYPDEPMPDLAPDLAVEVLSKDNTKAEMQRKLKEYFLAGTRLVWYVDPKKQTVRVFTAPDQSTLVGYEETLDGGSVLPGFSLPLRQLFARIRSPRGKGGKGQTSNGKGKK
jgi:Uma2 family endonuclease